MKTIRLQPNQTNAFRRMNLNERTALLAEAAASHGQSITFLAYTGLALGRHVIPDAPGERDALPPRQQTPAAPPQPGKPAGAVVTGPIIMGGRSRQRAYIMGKVPPVVPRAQPPADATIAAGIPGGVAPGQAPFDPPVVTPPAASDLADNAAPEEPRRAFIVPPNEAPQTRDLREQAAPETDEQAAPETDEQAAPETDKNGSAVA